MLDLMLSAADDSSLPESKKLSDAEIIAQSFVFLAAGYETTSTTLSFMSHHLAVDPEIQEKVQQEIDSVWPDENQMLSYDAVHEMPYLDMVAAEVLRMYPPGIRDSFFKFNIIMKMVFIMIAIGFGVKWQLQIWLHSQARHLVYWFKGNVLWLME